MRIQATLGALLAAASITAEARVTKIIIDSTTSNATTMTIVGRAVGELGPPNPANANHNHPSPGLSVKDRQAPYHPPLPPPRPKSPAPTRGPKLPEVPKRGGRVG